MLLALFVAGGVRVRAMDSGVARRRGRGSFHDERERRSRNAGLWLAGMPPGLQDLVAVKDTSAPASLVIRRNLDRANGAILPPIDFTISEAISPVIRPLTLSNSLGEPVTAFGGVTTPPCAVRRPGVVRRYSRLFRDSERAITTRRVQFLDGFD